jgi:hypothetical protein
MREKYIKVYSATSVAIARYYISRASHFTDNTQVFTHLHTFSSFRGESIFLLQLNAFTADTGSFFYPT